MKLFLLKISEAKDIKISVLYGLPVEKFEKKKKNETFTNHDCVEMPSIMVSWHIHVLKYYPQSFCGMCSFNGSNIVML